MIRSVTRYAISDEAAFTDQVRSLSALRHADAVKAKTVEIEQAQKRIEELDVVIQKLYESYALGKIPEKRYEMLSATYEKEQAQLRELLEKNEVEISNYNADSVSIEKFMALAHEYRDVSELTPAVINSFIDKIIVHAPKKINGQCTVPIEIIFRFIGGFTVPQIQLLPTEEERREEERRAKERERNHQKYLRRKARKEKVQMTKKASA